MPAMSLPRCSFRRTGTEGHEVTSVIVAWLPDGVGRGSESGWLPVGLVGSRLIWLVRSFSVHLFVFLVSFSFSWFPGLWVPGTAMLGAPGRSGSRYRTAGHVGLRVWYRVHGEHARLVAGTWRAWRT